MAFENTKAVFSTAKSVVSDRAAGAEGAQQSGLGRTIAGIRSLAKSGTYERLHGELAAVISQVKLTASALDNAALESLEMEYATRHAKALESGSEEERKVASDQLDALISIRKLMEGQGEALSERVLDREVLTNEDAQEVLDYLKGVTRSAELLQDDVRLQTAGAFESFLAAVSDERLSGAHRADVVKAVAEGVADSALFKGGSAAADLMALAASTDDLSQGDAGQRAAAALEAMSEKLSLAEVTHHLASTAVEGGLSKKEMDETLSGLLQYLRRMDGFSEEQVQLAKLISEDIAGDQGREDELRRILSKLADRTVESKTLFTLSQLNDKFDAAVLDQEQLTEALEKGGLGKEFLENAGSISAGGMGMDNLMSQVGVVGLMMGGLDPMSALAAGWALDAGAGSALGGLGETALGALLVEKDVW